MFLEINAIFFDCVDSFSLQPPQAPATWVSFSILASLKVENIVTVAS